MTAEASREQGLPIAPSREGAQMANVITLSIPAEGLDELIQRVAERLAEAIDRGGQPDSKWPAYMTIDTAAGYLDVSVERVRKLKERQEIPYIQEAPGHRVVFS